jgi:hypothetical protein
VAQGRVVHELLQLARVAGGQRRLVSAAALFHVVQPATERAGRLHRAGATSLGKSGSTNLLSANAQLLVDIALAFN